MSCGKRWQRREWPGCGEGCLHHSSIGAVSWPCSAVSTDVPGRVLRRQADTAPGFEVFNRLFMSWEGSSWGMSKELSNFLAGGMASNLYWAMALREFAESRSRV